MQFKLLTCTETMSQVGNGLAGLCSQQIVHLATHLDHYYGGN